MRRLFDPLVNNVQLEFHEMKNGRLSKPKSLKGKNKIDTVKCRGQSYQVFIDDDYNLWYKDNCIVHDYKAEIVGNNVEVTMITTKAWIKFSGIYELKNEFILDIVRCMSKASERFYNGNSVADNVALEDLYERLAKVYLEYLEDN